MRKQEVRPLLANLGRIVSRYRQGTFNRHKSLVANLTTLALLVGTSCSFTGDTAYYEKDWDYKRFNKYSTFQNTPIAEAEPTLSTEDSDLPYRLPHAVASSIVPWQIDPECRNKGPGQGDGDESSRKDVLVKCSENSPLDSSFVSVSISGGGTKSAVFSTEALLALDAWGVLDHVDAVSSVSGGSFSAALFGMSCDDRPQDSACENSVPNSHLIKWPNIYKEEGKKQIDAKSYKEISERASADLVLPQILGRFSPFNRFAQTATHRSAVDVLAENYVAAVLRLPASPAFENLNPHRPNIILNATNVSVDRRFFEREAGISPRDRRLRRRNEVAHFAFTDYYFERLLHSDLAQYPLGHGVAGSAAFPAIIDYLVLGRFSERVEPKDDEGATKKYDIDFIHLLDGGVHENHGLTEIRIALEEIFRLDGRVGLNTPLDEAEGRHGLQPKEILALIVDSSTVDVNGISQKDPAARGIDAAISPFRALIAARAFDTLLAANAGQHLDRFDATISRINEGCGPGTRCETVARSAHIAITTLDGADEVESDGEFAECEYDPTKDRGLSETSSEQGLGCRVMTSLKTAVSDIAAYRTRKSWADLHPQCYFEVTRQAPTSYDIDEDMATCLRHAARWAVAIRMTELCYDDEFRTSGAGLFRPSIDKSAADSSDLVGIDCTNEGIVETLSALPPLPQCRYEDLMNGGYDQKREARIGPRSWLEIPRQRAHCACSGPYKCQAEALFASSEED